MNTQAIKFKIEYKEEMTMKELVDEINKSNDAIMTAINATLKEYEDRTLSLIKTEFKQLNSDIAKIKTHFGIQ